MRMADTADLWWKSAIIYCADVQTFLDSDGDGQGDLVGMTQRIDYLADLGITCLWLMPFYPTADRDDGYDVTDFQAVDPRLGTLGDLVELVRTARSRGIGVVIDLVMNHTSDKHPWFRSALKGPDSPYRDYYVWRSSTPPDTSDLVVFPDREDSIGERDEKSGEHYLHNFYRTQPDLNMANPAVRHEVEKVLGLWIELGVSGFRVDAVPFMLAVDDLPAAEQEFHFDPHEALRQFAAFCGRRDSAVVMLGEVNLPFDQQKEFFGGDDGDELTLQFDVNGMQAIWLALARGDARPIAQSLRARPDLDVGSQWCTFLRNHDELTLDKLTDAERQEVFEAFGPDPEMQLYDRGLRRRLPTMLHGDPRRIRMAYSLMFSLPGTPALFYGEEIGMGENLDIPDRYAVRTPMQWSPGRHGGFSDAAPARLARPVTEGLFGPERVNVSDQRNDRDSLLAFMGHLIRRRRQSPEIGWGELEVLEGGPRSVLAHVVRVDDWALVALHNLTDEPCEVEHDLASLTEAADEDAPRPAPILHLADLLAGGEIALAGTVLRTDLAGYGCRWLRVVREGDTRIA